MKHVDAALILIVCHQANFFERGRFESQRRLNYVRLLQLRIELNTTGGRNGLNAADKGIWVTRVRNDQIALSLTIDSQRLFVSLCPDPVVKNSRSSANCDVGLFKW